MPPSRFSICRCGPAHWPIVGSVGQHVTTHSLALLSASPPPLPARLLERAATILPAARVTTYAWRMRAGLPVLRPPARQPSPRCALPRSVSPSAAPCLRRCTAAPVLASVRGGERETETQSERPREWGMGLDLPMQLIHWRLGIFEFGLGLGWPRFSENILGRPNGMIEV